MQWDTQQNTLAVTLGSGVTLHFTRSTAEALAKRKWGQLYYTLWCRQLARGGSQ